MLGLGLGLTRRDGGGAAAAAATLSSFSMSDVDDIWATINVTTDTGSGTLYWVIVPTAAAVPSEEQIKAGTDGSDVAATIDGSISVASSGAKTQLAYGLAVNTAYDTYVVQETSAFSNIVTAEFTTDASTITARLLHDGSLTGFTGSGSNRTANAADSLGGTNGVSLVDVNDAATGACTIATPNTVVFFNGVTRIRFRAKLISSSAANLWARLLPSNTTVAPLTHVNFTAKNATGATTQWASMTVTDLDGTWMQIDGTANMTGADVTGIFNIQLGDANNDTTVVRDGTHSIGLHDLIVSNS